MNKFLFALVLSVAVLGLSGAERTESSQTWQPASPEKLPRWRGFNLLEKFMLPSGRKPFLEEDFRLISKLGFNFVRLPMDYRFWVKSNNWEQFDEVTLKEIDQAVAWGKQYGIHVCLNFHRAPGYTVAKPEEPTSLWTNPETQRICALHWATFARRYRGIPNERLSFNLMNEPANVDAQTYVRVVGLLAQAIRKEDPDRLIISDGLQWGSQPIPELKPLRIAQATRGYTPFYISHYKASWANGENLPVPVWPKPVAPNGILLSPSKVEGSHPLIINGPFSSAMELRMHVMTVSTRAKLIVEADEKPVFEKVFVCGAGQGEWKKADFKAQWNVYQNLFDKDYTGTIPSGTKQIKLRVTEGDWLEVGEIGLRVPGGNEAVMVLDRAYGKKPEPVHFLTGKAGGVFQTGKMEDREFLKEQTIVPWQKLEAQGVGVVVGEWGAYNKTPHDVFLHWAEDCLKNWQEVGWGWALWNFHGSFGVLDSERADVKYENFEGHKLDRKLLDLLQRY